MLNREWNSARAQFVTLQVHVRVLQRIPHARAIYRAKCIASKYSLSSFLSLLNMEFECN